MIDNLNVWVDMSCIVSISNSPVRVKVSVIESGDAVKRRNG